MDGSKRIVKYDTCIPASRLLLRDREEIRVQRGVNNRL